MAKYHLLKIMIARFFNREWYDTHPSNKFHTEVEDNIVEDEESIANDVLDFCLHTDVCKTLNLSPVDIMQHFDLPTYNLLKKKVLKDNERKAKILDRTQKEIQTRQNQITGSMTNGKN